MTSAPLKTLNARSATVSKFDVAIYNPVLHKYTYQNKKTGEMKDGQTFRCLLVCTQDCSQYLAATLTMQGTNAKPLTEAVANFKKNKRFRMDKTRLKYGVQQQYIHTPVKVVVDMAGTRFDALVSDGDGDAEQLAPEPPMSVADCVLLTQNQQFDVTALVEQIDPEREVNDQRVVREIVLVDGSKIQEKLQQLRLSFFYDRYPSAKDQAILKMLENAAENAKPLILFAIQGKRPRKGTSSKLPATSSSPQPPPPLVRVASWPYLHRRSAPRRRKSERRSRQLSRGRTTPRSKGLRPTALCCKACAQIPT